MIELMWKKLLLRPMDDVAGTSFVFGQQQQTRSDVVITSQQPSVFHRTRLEFMCDQFPPYHVMSAMTSNTTIHTIPSQQLRGGDVKLTAT